MNSLSIRLFYWAEHFLSKLFRRVCEIWIPSVRWKSLVTRKSFFIKLLTCSDVEQKLLGFVWKFFQWSQQNCHLRLQKEFSTRSFSKNCYFIHNFGTLIELCPAFWQFLFSWIVKTAGYLSVVKVWGNFFWTRLTL